MQEDLDKSLDLLLNHMEGRESPAHRTLRTLASWPRQVGIWASCHWPKPTKCEYVKSSFGIQSLLGDGWLSTPFSAEPIHSLLRDLSPQNSLLILCDL